VGREALALGDDALPADAEPVGNGGVGGVRISTGEHNAGSHRHILMGASPANQGLKGFQLHCGEGPCNRPRSTGHGRSQKRGAQLAPSPYAQSVSRRSNNKKPSARVALEGLFIDIKCQWLRGQDLNL
jgi:hypothetical protein